MKHHHVDGRRESSQPLWHIVRVGVEEVYHPRAAEHAEKEPDPDPERGAEAAALAAFPRVVVKVEGGARRAQVVLLVADGALRTRVARLAVGLDTNRDGRVGLKVSCSY